MRRGLAALISLFWLAGCGDDLRSPPHVLEVDGVRITVTEAPARIEIVRVADGEVIFDGLAARFRDADPRIETQVGAFKIEEDPDAPWRDIGTLQFVEERPDGFFFELAAGGERIGHGSVLSVPGRVTIDVESRGDHNRASIGYRCEPGEHFLGLGGQAFDVDHRGQTVPLWVEEDGITKRDDDQYEGVWFLAGRRHSTHTPMPMMLSSRGYAAVVDTPARAVFALCSDDPDEVRLETWEPRLALHLFPGEPEDVTVALMTMHDWVGRPGRPPDFAFAPWLDAIYGEAEVRRVAQKLRAEDIAVSAIWTEDWRGGNDEGTGYVLEEDWRVDRDLYPGFETLADDLHGDGFKFLTYHNTFIDEEADVFAEAIDAGYTIHQSDGEPYLFTGVKFRPASMLDLTNADAVAWARGVYAEGLALGADGWMADFAEWLPHDAVLASGEDPMLHHNRYPVEWAKLNRELMEGTGGLTFVRSAWLGSQPFVQVIWGGDQQTDFTEGDGMRSVIPIGLGLGITGFPVYGHDIAGYMSQLTVPTTKELWFRWCTLGALSPVMRTHHGRDARDNWNWESDAETTAHLRRWSKLHMQLFPYLSAALDSGLPIMRPVALHYPELEWAWTTTDQYMLGDRILVAPVLDEGASSREVQLPPGTWYPLMGGAPVEGGGAVTVDAPITEIPAFVAEGSIIPLYLDTVDTVVEAPDSPTTITPDASGIRAILWVHPGTAPAGSHVDELVDIDQGFIFYWSGRDRSLPAPTTANGMPVTVGPGYVSVLSVGGTVEFEGGGTITTSTADDTSTYEIRLRVD